MAEESNSQPHSDEHWRRILRSSLASAYVRELYWLARNNTIACEAIFEAAKPPPDEQSSYIKVDHEVHARIYEVLNNAARIRALVTIRRRRVNQQSAEQHMIQDARTKWLGELLSSVQIQETLRAQVRNSLEHFDEYLDEAFLNFSKRPPNGRLLLPLDMTLGRESTLDQFADGGSVYPLRVYLAEERVFINCGKRVSIGLLHSECRGILDFLRNAVPSLAEEEDPGGRGSPMFVLTPTSFDEP